MERKTIKFLPSSFQFSRQGERLLVNVFLPLSKGVDCCREKRQIFQVSQEEQKFSFESEWWRFFNYLFLGFKLEALLKSCFFSPRTRSLHFHLAAGSKNHNFIIKPFTIPKVQILSIKIEKLTKRHLNKFLKMVRWRFCQFLYFGILFYGSKCGKLLFGQKLDFWHSVWWDLAS